MPRFNPDDHVPNTVTGYPAPFDREVGGRWKRRIGPVAGFSHLGACHVTLEPGAWSSQRHWHDGEDELVVMLAGEAVLVEDGGRTVLRAGDIATWAAGVRDGHHLINESDAPCVFVAVSAGARTGGGYSDIDMLFTADDRYVHRDGTPYPEKQ
ncbi:MAG: cupin domain-containing protein [Sphingomonadales bacterium]|nr:cupin domain-containing protein [Sphingomonadales bacterium]